MEGNGQNLRAELEGGQGTKNPNIKERLEEKDGCRKKVPGKAKINVLTERDLVLEASMWIGW